MPYTDVRKERNREKQARATVRNKNKVEKWNLGVKMHMTNLF